MAHKLVIPIIGDSTSYERALKRSSTATQQFGQALGTTSPKVGKFSQTAQLAGSSSLFFAGAAAGMATAIGAKSITAASDLNEQISRTQVVLGGAAEPGGGGAHGAANSARRSMPIAAR